MFVRSQAEIDIFCFNIGHFKDQGIQRPRDRSLRSWPEDRDRGPSPGPWTGYSPMSYLVHQHFCFPNTQKYEYVLGLIFTLIVQNPNRDKTNSSNQSLPAML